MEKHHGDTEDTEKIEKRDDCFPPCSPCLRGSLIVFFVLSFAVAIRIAVLLVMPHGLQKIPMAMGGWR